MTTKERLERKAVVLVAAEDSPDAGLRALAARLLESELADLERETWEAEYADGWSRDTGSM